MYQFAIINPRNPVVPANTLGIEVTIPEVAALCDLGNIDPQHGCSTTRVRIHDPATGEDKGYRLDPVVWAGHGAIDCGGGPRDCLPRAAIDAVIAWPPPAAPADPGKCVTLATIRPDLDSLGAMAVFALRAAGVKMTADALARIEAIAAADGNARTTWEPQPLPTRENPWPPGVEIGSRRELAAINAVCALHNTAVAYRVAIVAAWLLGGDEPTPEQVHVAAMAVSPQLSADPFNVIDTLAECRARVEAERADMIAALSDGRISITCTFNQTDRTAPPERARFRGEGPVLFTTERHVVVERIGSTCYEANINAAYAVVRSAHRAATSLGQSVAPLAICFHPAFPWPSGEPTPKATIAWAAPPGAAVVRRVRDALNAAEREKIATQIDSIDLGVTYEGGWPGVFFDARKGQSDPGAATLLRAGDATAALDVIANIAPANAARFAEDVAVIKAALKSERGGNLASGILGSPQGRASMLSEDEIVNIVRETLSA